MAGVSDTDVAREVGAADVIVVVTPHKCFLSPEPPALPSPSTPARGGDVTLAAGVGEVGEGVGVAGNRGKGWGIERALKAYKGPVVDTRNWVPSSWGLNVYKA